MTRPRTARELRSRAVRLLRRYDIDAPPIPVEELATNMGVTVKILPYEGELSGMIYRKDEKVFIGVNSLHHPNRQRFTIAHEIGHFLLHEGKEFHVDKSFRINLRDNNSSLAVDSEEIEANRFAAELLMPFNMLQKDLLNKTIDMEDEHQIKNLAKIYIVSVQAMTHRITNIFYL